MKAICKIILGASAIASSCASASTPVTVTVRDWWGQAVGTVRGVSFDGAFRLDVSEFFPTNVDYVTAFDGGAVSAAPTATVASGTVVTWAGLDSPLDTEIFVQPYVPVGSEASPSAADPFVVRDQSRGVWYLTSTYNGRLATFSTTRWPVELKSELAIGNGYSLVDHASELEGYTNSVWAPEFHYLDGKWWAYLSASTGSGSAKERLMAFVSDGTPTEGNWSFAGRLETPDGRWSIDPTVFENSDGTRRYCAWSGWPGSSNGRQNIYIAEMSSPTSFVANAARTLVSTPDQSWETGTNPVVNEGPVVLRHGRKTILVYSGNGSWTDNYALGYLVCTNEQYLSASAWTKHRGAVLTKREKSYGPGHCSFTTDAQGRDFIVFHANPFSGKGWTGRKLRTQPFAWHDDEPVFGVPRPYVGIYDSYDGSADYTCTNTVRALVSFPDGLVESVEWTGAEQSPSWASSPELTVVSGSSRTDRGTNAFVVALSDTAKYRWSDGTPPSATKSALFVVGAIAPKPAVYTWCGDARGSWTNAANWKAAGADD